MMLRKGQRFMVAGQRYRVEYVNGCRAHCVAIAQKTVTIHDAKTGCDRTFRASVVKTLDISPDSHVEGL